MQDAENRLLLPSHGSIYKLLSRLTKYGVLESRWEDGEAPQREGRPPRRLYRLTGLGVEVGQSVRAGITVTLDLNGLGV